MKKLVETYTKSLAASADQSKKEWWERYLKQEIEFLGVGIPTIRDVLLEWYDAYGVDRLTDEEKLMISTELFRGRYAEHKLSGVLFYQLFLMEALDFRVILSSIESVLYDRLIYDWNTCDWLCVRVLTPLIDKHGMEAAEIISGWKNAEYIWHARAALVPFTQVENIERYGEIIYDVAEVLIKREERFGKTAVGWCMREYSKVDKHYVMDFLSQNALFLTTEVIDNALKYFEADEKKEIMDMKKSIY